MMVEFGLSLYDGADFACAGFKCVGGRLAALTEGSMETVIGSHRLKFGVVDEYSQCVRLSFQE
jgi:hypothetical protein